MRVAACLGASLALVTAKPAQSETALSVYEPRESGPIRTSRNPDRMLEDFTGKVPQATAYGSATFTMEIEQGGTPCGGGILRVDLPATHQRGAHGVDLLWKLPAEQRDWSGFNQLVVWFDSPKGGAIDLGGEGGVWYGRGVIIGFRDKTGKWFETAGEVLPYMGGTWVPLRIRFSQFNRSPRPDLKSVDAFKIRLVSHPDFNLSIRLADIGLERIPVESPEIAIQARTTGYLTSPSSDFALQLAATRLPAGKTGEVVFQARDYWGRTAFERKLAFPGPEGSMEQEVVLPISGPGYFDLSAILSVDGKEVWRAYRGLACLPPLTEAQTVAKKASIFSIWTGYHDALGGDYVRKFLVLPPKSSDISPEGVARGAWKVPAPPPGTLGICCVVPPAFWGKQWLNPATTPEQYAEFSESVEAAVRMAADGRFPYYEVINEPNAKYFGPMDKLVEYHRLVADAIRRGDPKAKVGGPCPYGINVDYIEKFLAAGGDKIVDFISVHGYAKDDDDFQKSLKDLRAMLKRRGLQDMEILITEKGVSLPSSTPEEQAKAIPRSYVIAMSEGVRVMTWHALMGGAIDKAGERGINNAAPDFNIIRADGSANPAFVSYGIMTRALLGAAFVKPVEGLPEGCTGYEFRKTEGTRVLVLWKKLKGSETTRLQLAAGEKATFQDIMGVSHPLTADSDGLVSVELTENPIYLITAPAALTP